MTRSSPLRGVVWRGLWLALASLWLGGLTFYSLVVVPIGARVTSSTTQGFITQRVTVWLNALGTAYLLCTLADATGRAGRGRQCLWLVLAAAQVALWSLHPVLDALLDYDTLSVGDPSQFYGWHRLYLLATTIQWVAGLLHVAWIGCGASCRQAPAPANQP